MVMRMAALLGTALLLSGCAPALLIYGEGRRSSKESIMPIMATEKPDLAPDGSSTCIIKGMTVSEVVRLPNSKTVQRPDTLRTLVQEVMTRPGVADCLAAAPKAAAARPAP